MKLYFIALCCIFSQILFAQKNAYIPLYLQDTTNVDGKQFTWDKTAESDNFILIWGNTVGTDPSSYSDPNLAFNPQVILDTLEYIYHKFKTFKFVDDQPGTNLSLYKIPVVMYNTWGPDGAQGYANGGDADGVIGAFWVHPIAMHGGHVAAHELTHSLQAQSVIDYRNQHGLGPVWNNAGIFWETHANFMRNLLYPEDVTAWGMDVYHIETWGDWKNTYENYELLMSIAQLGGGMSAINQMWRESLSDEYPLQAYKRLQNLTQPELNDRMFIYARTMATHDFFQYNLGTFFRQYRKNDLMNYLPSIQATYTILQQDSEHPTHYSVPIELAPEEYGYNIIPLYPDPDSCQIIIKFKGHTEINTHAGWRYGYVAARADGTTNSYVYLDSKDESEFALSLLGNETNLYLVIMGAPKDSITTNTTNDTWHGYPKHFRYPYELNISGGVPEGFQNASDFRSQIKSNGHLHVNGGGWIENSATVDPSVYVSPYAVVRGNAIITGNVKLLNTSLVRDANISGDVIIKNNAFVTGGTLSDSAVISGQAFVENATLWDHAKVYGRAHVSNYKLHGNIEVGGDVIVYNNQGDCDNGVYYRLTNYYDDKFLECDGRTATHPDNLDVNNPLIPFSPELMDLHCNCNNYPNCLTVATNDLHEDRDNIEVYPNPTSGLTTINFNSTTKSTQTFYLYNSVGTLMLRKNINSIQQITIDFTGYPPGLYFGSISGRGSKTVKIVVP